MTDNVEYFPGLTRLDIPPDRVLKFATNQLDKCVIVGVDKDGGFYFASSVGSPYEVLWLIATAQAKLLEVENAQS